MKSKTHVISLIVEFDKLVTGTEALEHIRGAITMGESFPLTVHDESSPAWVKVKNISRGRGKKQGIRK